MLHTQGTEYVIDEVQRFINRRKRKWGYIMAQM
jgi:hypothetical protein